MDIEKLKAFPDDGMMKVLDRRDEFQLGVAHFDVVFKVSGIRLGDHIRILVDTRAKHLPAVATVILRIIGASAKEADAHGCFADNHGDPLDVSKFGSTEHLVSL